MNRNEIHAEACRRLEAKLDELGLPVPHRATVIDLVNALGDLLPTHSRDELHGGYQFGGNYTIDEHPPTYTVRTYSGTASLDDNAEYDEYVQWHRDRNRPTLEEYWGLGNARR